MMWIIKTVHLHECGSQYEQYWGPFPNSHRAWIYGRSMQVDFGDRLVSWSMQRLIVPFVTVVDRIEWRK